MIEPEFEIKSSYIDEDGVRVITDARLVSTSLVPNTDVVREYYRKNPAEYTKLLLDREKDD